MPTIVNPMDALKTFEPALRSGEISIQRGEVEPDLFVHLDHPNGEVRVTYARFKNGSPENGSVTGLAIIIPAGFEDGLPVFQIGYAVPQNLRKRGNARDVSRAAIAEFRAGMARNGITSFRLEAIVGMENLASQKVAESIFGLSKKETVDEHSGEAVLQYIVEIGPDTPPL